MEKFQTSDTKLAAFLKAAGVPFLECVNLGPRHAFVFERVEGIRALKNQFFARVPDSLASLSLFNEYDALMALLHTED